MVVVAVVGAVVCQVVLQAGPRGGGVTAAERNAVQQVTAVHVTPDATGTRKKKGEKSKTKWSVSASFFSHLWHILLLSWQSSVVTLCLVKPSVLTNLWDVLTFSFCVTVLIIVHYYVLIYALLNHSLDFSSD